MISDLPRSEPSDQIYVCVLQEGRGRVIYDELAEEDLCRREVEAEFGITTETIDVGPGASIPAFLAILQDNAAVIAGLAVLFSGKRVRENLHAWVDLAIDIRKFFNRKTVLSRNGATVIALDAIIKKQKKLPGSVVLKLYELRDSRYPDLRLNESTAPICDTPETIWLAYVIHVFHFEIDGKWIRVSVDGTRVSIESIDVP